MNGFNKFLLGLVLGVVLSIPALAQNISAESKRQTVRKISSTSVWCLKVLGIPLNRSIGIYLQISNPAAKHWW